MSYSPAVVNYNLFDKLSWTHLGKFLVVEVGIGMIVAAICVFLIFSAIWVDVSINGAKGFLGGFGGLFIGILLSTVVVVFGQMYALGVYENWIGCHLKE